MPEWPDQVYNIWRLRAVEPDGSAAWIALILSTQHPHESLVELPTAEAEALLGPDRTVAVARYVEGRVVNVQVSRLAAPSAPPLWFVELDEPGHEPPAISLLAYTDLDEEPGAFLDRAAARRAKLRNVGQVGAFRWFPETGFADQVYVAPEWRRRTVATALLAAVGVVTAARDWKPVWGSGQRTADGERWKNGSMWADTTPEITHLLPPMTPFDQR